jgi:hypothetical protein
MDEPKQAFVPPEDRPEVKLDPNAPISELRVRDLSAILGQAVFKKFDIKEPFKEFKDHKLEKFEIKEFKFEKIEKFEKLEHEKWWPDKFIEPPNKFFEPPKLADGGPVIDPTIGDTLGKLVESVSGLTAQVDAIGKRVEALEKRSR